LRGPFLVSSGRAVTQKCGTLHALKKFVLDNTIPENAKQRYDDDRNNKR
jgi:hypothetical protein